MYKLLLLAGTFSFIACTNQTSSPAAGTDTTASGSTMPNMVRSLPPQSEMEILAGCVDNAKGQLGEQKAFALCKCVLGQVQDKYPGADSTAIVAHLTDTAEVAQMAMKCK